MSSSSEDEGAGPAIDPEADAEVRNHEWTWIILGHAPWLFRPAYS